MPAEKDSCWVSPRLGFIVPGWFPVLLKIKKGTIMAWLAVNRNGEELVFNDLPTYDRVEDTWKVNCTREELVYDDPHDFSAGHHCEEVDDSDYGITLPKGTIEKIIGNPLSFADDPVEIC